MARGIRIEFPGARYHVMARGNRRELIFRDAHDHRFFLKALAEACGMTGWQVHAWVLMRNHYHLLIETPSANLVAGMRWLQNTYTRRFNVRHKQWGRLFGDRYKAIPVDRSDYYYETLLDYIHLNPARAGLIDPSQGHGILDYPWSSVAGGYALPPRERAAWLAAPRGLAVFGFPDTLRGRRQFVQRLDKRIAKEQRESLGIPPEQAREDKRYSDLRHGWYWGSQAFRERLLSLCHHRLDQPKTHSSLQGLESKHQGEIKARQLLAEGLRAAALTTEALPGLRGSDPRKVAIARVLRANSTASLQWICDHLAMKSAANVSQQIRRAKDEEKLAARLPNSMRPWYKLSRVAD